MNILKGEMKHKYSRLKCSIKIIIFKDMRKIYSWQGKNIFLYLTREDYHVNYNKKEGSNQFHFL